MKSANDAILLADEHERIIECNDRMLEMYGYASARLRGMRLIDLRAPEVRADFGRQRQSLIATGHALVETLHQRKDGSVFPVEISTRCILIEGVRQELSILRDISERKTHEREIERLTRLYATLSEINQALVRTPSRDQLFKEVCRIAAENGGFKLVWVGWLDRETQQVCPVAVIGEMAGYLEKVKIYADERPEGRGLVGTCIRENRPCISNDFAKDVRTVPWHEAAAAHGLQAVAALPIRLQQEVCGVLVVYAAEPNVFQDKEVALLEEIAADISFGLIHLEQQEKAVRAEKALRESEDLYRTLVDASPEAITVTDLEGNIVFTSPKALELFGLSSADERIGRRVVEWVAPTEHEKARENLQRILTRGLRGATEHTLVRKDGTRFAGEVNAALVRAADGSPKAIVFSTRDITERKRSETLLRTRLRLSELASRANSEELMQTALDAAELLTDSRMGYFHSIDQNQESLTLQAWSTNTLKHLCRAEGKGQHYPIHEAGVWVDCFHLRAPVIHNDYASLPHRKGLPEGHAPVIRDLSVPILRDGLVVAILGVGNKPTDYTQGDVEIVRELASMAMDIVARKQAETALRNSEALYHALVENLPQEIFRKDLAGRFTLVNQRFCAALGQPAGEILGKTDYDFFSSVLATKYREDDRRVLDSGQTFEAVEENRVPDGPSRYVQVIKIPLRDGQGRIVGMQGVSWDITERTQAEQALLRRVELQDQLAQTAATVPGMIYSFKLRPDGSTCMPYASGELEKVYGLQAEDVREDATPLLSLIHPEDIVRVNQGIAESARGLTPWRAEFRVCNTRRGELWLEGHSVPHREADGSVLWHGFLQDITDRKQAEARLRFQATALEAAANGIVITDRAGVILWANEAFVNMTGYSLEEALGQKPSMLKSGRHDAAFYRELWATVVGGKVWHGELVNRRKDGSVYSEEMTITPVPDEGGRISHFVAIKHDITERKKLEQQITLREQRLNSFFRGATAGLALVDKDLRFLQINDTLAEMNGVSAEAHLGRTLREVLPKLAPVLEPICARVLATGEPILNHEVSGETPRDPGVQRYWIESFFPVADNHGKPNCVGAMVVEVTDRKQLEAQLRQAQKMEAVGQLAGGVAHDFNNILAATLMHLGLLRANEQLDQETKEGLKELEAQAQRAANLTRQLLLFGRRSVLQVKSLDLNEVVENLLKMLRRLLGEHIDVEFRGKTALPQVEADAGMMDQVVVNLSVNARDAMPKGGRLTIGTDVVEIDPAQVELQSERRCGRFVKLSVADTGCGMDALTIKRIFEPFFTTKEVGKGTGLGLATVYGIVKQHTGWVEVESQVGLGSTFHIFLPAVTPAATKEAASPAVEPVKGGAETILVVEDELAVRRTLIQLLRRFGYRVLEAVDGQEALALWPGHKQEIDLLFTDMVMPEGLSGLDLAQQLRLDKPGLKVIVSSGYSAEITARGLPAEAGMTYLAKPYKAATLGRVVRACLDGP